MVAYLVSDLLGVGGFVDPRAGRELGRSWRSADEPFRGRGVGGVEDGSSGGVRLLGEAVVDGGWGHQADPGVAVLLVLYRRSGYADLRLGSRCGGGDRRVEIGIIRGC